MTDQRAKLSDSAQKLYNAMLRREKARSENRLSGTTVFYDAIDRLWNEDDAIELILSGLLTERQINDLIRIGRGGASVAKESSETIWGLTARLREHRSELPDSINDYLDWLWNVAGY